MNMFAIEARKPPRIGSIAIISGTLLCAAGAVGPALSADLPYEYTPYRSDYYRNSYYSGCYRCSCCGRRYAPVVDRGPVEERVSVVERPVVERAPVAERHWVQRDYIERRYSGARYAYPTHYRYSYYYPGSDVEYDSAASESRPRFSYESRPYPPASVAYEYEAQRPLYRYVASSRPYDYRPSYEYEYFRPSHEGYRPSYEYDPSPRPPAAVPSGYYGPGYAE